MGSSNLDRELHQARNMWNAAHSSGDYADGLEEEFLTSIEADGPRHRLGNDGIFRALG